MASVKFFYCFTMLSILLVSGTVIAEQAWFFDDGAEWQETRWDPQWRTDPNWYPGVNDATYVGWGKTAYINSSGNEVKTLKLGPGAPGNTLYIQSGGITINTTLELVSNAGVDMLEISGGLLTVGDGAGDYVNNWNSQSTFRIIGGDPNLSGTAYFNSHGILEFVIDGTGIEPIPWNTGFGSSGTISLKADNAAPGTYTLFEPYGDYSRIKSNTYTLITEHPGEGLYWVANQLYPYGTVTIAEAGWASMPDPADGQENVAVSKILSWDAPSPGLNPSPVYNIYFDTDPNFPGGPVLTDQTDKFFDPGLLSNGLTYYWKVDVEGNTENEVVWSFTTEPLKAINPKPADGQTEVLPETTLSWGAPSSVADPSYNVYLATDPNDPNTLVLLYSGSDESFNPDPDLLFSASYKWRVDIDDDGTVFEGDVWTFTTKDPAAKVLEWKMDEASGTTVPDTAGSNNGTAVNAPSWVSGIDGNCLKFNDNGDYVNKLGATGLPLTGTDTWSINMYLFLEQPFAHWTVLGGFGLDSGGPCRYIMNMNNKITFYPQGSPFISSTGFDVGWWQMLTASYDGTTLKMYKNGIEILSQAVTLGNAGPEVWLSPLDIWGQGHVNGKIDEFTIWDDALTQGELDALASIIPLRGDMDGDGDVDMDDLLAFVVAWLPTVPEPCVGGSVAGDFNGDCVVNLIDFGYVAEGWLK